MLLKKARKMQNRSFSRSKRWFFGCKHFFKNWHVEKISTQNLKRCIFLSSKYDALYFINLKIWRVVFFLSSKSDTYWNFQIKIMLLKKERKMQKRSFSRSKRNQNVVFWIQTLFQKLTCRKNFNSKSKAFIFFRPKISCVVNLLNQNPTRCESFVSKPNALDYFISKTDRFWNFFAKIWFLSYFSGSDWIMIPSVNVNTNLF